MTKYFAALLIFLAAWPSYAADLNGYTAQYECRAGGPNCNIDVVALANQACQQTINPGDAWSTINWSNNVICIASGDHTSKGTLTITTSGTSGAYKVLRYYRANDNNDEPWNQSSTAKIRSLVLNANFWIIHRLHVSGSGSTGSVGIRDNRNNLIVNRLLVENGSLDQIDGSSNTSDIAIQNSVVRKTGKNIPSDFHGIVTSAFTTRFYVVNNEIYDVQGDGVQISQSGGNTTDMVIENNDVYLTSDYYIGNNGCAENALDLKQGGQSANPLRIIHNRLWGHRNTDSSCATGSSGEEIVFHEASTTTNNYGLIQNNIIFDGTQAIASPNFSPDHWSIIGNIIYSMSGVSGDTTKAIDLKNGVNHEVYLNTIVDVNKSNSNGWINGGASSNDIRCNAIISGGSGGSGTQDHNVYYNSTDSGESHKIVKTASTRANLRAYSVGDVVFSASLNNFLYQAVNNGTSGSSAPTWCTELGCTISDGSVTWQAFRGPYTFWRKLRTMPEQYTIPYVKVHASAPEANYCPSNYSSRQGNGISDIQP